MAALLHMKRETIEALGKTFTCLINTLRRLLDLRKLRQEAEKVLGTEEELKAKFDRKIEERIDDAVKKRTQKLLDTYKNGDLARSNELGVALDFAQGKLLVRIERGMAVEVRAALPEGSGQQAEIYAKIVDVGRSLQIPSTEGPPVLKLPPSGAAVEELECNGCSMPLPTAASAD